MAEHNDVKVDCRLIIFYNDKLIDLTNIEAARYMTAKKKKKKKKKTKKTTQSTKKVKKGQQKRRQKKKKKKKIEQELKV